MPVAKAFNEALHVAKSMPGWTIIASDGDTGHIEASQQSRWSRFTDDIVIRVSSEVAGSRIDMRSTSRQGRRTPSVDRIAADSWRLGSQLSWEHAMLRLEIVVGSFFTRPMRQECIKNSNQQQALAYRYE